jgi:hypothetical protein
MSRVLAGGFCLEVVQEVCSGNLFERAYHSGDFLVKLDFFTANYKDGLE